MFKKKYFLILLIALYFISRVTFLNSVPIFNDESTYLRVAAHQINEPDHNFYSLRIGKEPLLPYLFGIAGEITGDYLVGGRIVSIFFGFLTLIGIFYFTKQLFGDKASVFAGTIYVLSPYNLFFDRLALLDGAVSTISVWSLFLTYLLFKHQRWKYVFLLAFITALGVWIKATGLFFVFLPLIGFSLFYFLDKSTKDKKNYVLIQILSALGIAILSYFILYSHPFYSEYKLIIAQYTYPFSRIFTFPFGIWIDNLSSISQWLLFYPTPFVLILSLLFVISKKGDLKNSYLIYLWFLLPFLYEVALGKTLTSRHSLLLTIPLIVLAGVYLSTITKKTVLYSILAVFISISSFYNLTLYLNPQKLPEFYPLKAKSDLMQYFYGFSSGYGVMEAIDYLKSISKERDIAVIIRNDFGNPEDAVVGFLHYENNTLVIPLNTVDQDQFRKIIEALLKESEGKYPIYFVSRGPHFAGADMYFKDEKIFKKPNDREFVGVYEMELR